MNRSVSFVHPADQLHTDHGSRSRQTKRGRTGRRIHCRKGSSDSESESSSDGRKNPRGRRSRSRFSNKRRNPRRRSRYHRSDTKSDSSGSSRNFRKSPQRNKAHANEDEILASLVQGVAVLSKLQVESAARERRKTSVIGRLAPRQAFLFTALSAQDWDDKKPKMTKTAELLLEDRDMERGWNLVRDLTNKWAGMISKPAFIQFMTGGFIAPDRPGGLTCFAFSPPRKLSYGKKDRKRNLRNVLGSKKEIDDEDLEFYAKNDFYIPRSVEEGELQIKMCLQFLEAMTHQDSIATSGYVCGLDLLDDHRVEFYESQGKDHMFMAKYVHLLDTVFQNFCEKLSTYHLDRRPIQKARRRLEFKMEDDLERVMQDFELNMIPSLPLPPGLFEQSDDPGEAVTPQKARVGNDDKKTGPHVPEWWTTNPGSIPQWSIPVGRKLSDFFDAETALGKQNRLLIPSVRHHNPKVQKMRSLCMRYQDGKCRHACGLAHVIPSQMDANLKDTVNAAVKKIYKK